METTRARNFLFKGLALLLAAFGASAASADDHLCTASTAGSIYTIPATNSVKATCVGSDCSGKNLSVPYVSLQTSDSVVMQCQQAGPGGGYWWAAICSYGRHIARTCKPAQLPCPTCTSTSPKYWFKPNVVTTHDASYDSCKAHPSAAVRELALAGEASDQQNVAADDVSLGQAMGLIPMPVQLMCIALPD